MQSFNLYMFIILCFQIIKIVLKYDLVMYIFFKKIFKYFSFPTILNADCLNDFVHANINFGYTQPLVLVDCCPLTIFDKKLFVIIF